MKEQFKFCYRRLNQSEHKFMNSFLHDSGKFEIWCRSDNQVTGHIELDFEQLSWLCKITGMIDLAEIKKAMV